MIYYTDLLNDEIQLKSTAQQSDSSAPMGKHLVSLFISS